MKLLSDAEMTWIKVGLEELNWKCLVMWEINAHDFKALRVDIEHIGFTVEGFPNDDYHKKILGIETIMGRVISMWTWEELETDSPYVLGFATGRHGQMWGIKFKTIADRIAWTYQDQPFLHFDDFQRV